MTRLLYNLLFPFALLAILPRYLARMFRRGDYRRDFGQRFARYAPELRGQFKRGDWLWVHAVSVGELLIALRVIRELHRRQPAWRFVVSSTTSTAHAHALAHREDWWVPVYTPVDFGPFVRRALDTVQPRTIVLTESEIWPNFVWTATARGIPVVLINARVSPRSASRYRRFAAFLRPVTSLLATVGLQEEEHATLWKHLGVPDARLEVTGSVKFDPADDGNPPRDFRPVLQAHGFAQDDPLLLAGSTHDGEEAILADALRALRKSFPSLRLLIAPRHVERTREIRAQLESAGLRVALRDAAPAGAPPDVLLINTTGELRDWYRCADVVFIGKSLAGIGGQNPVEAILAGKPVLFGPHMENFAALRDALLAHGGAVQVADALSVATAASRLLGDPGVRAKLVERAMQALRPHRDAVVRTAALVERAVMGSDSRR